MKNNITSTEHEEKEQDGIKHNVPLFGIFWTFFRIGLFTFGGGLAMTTVMRHELVLKRRWIKEESFLAELSTATLVPGAIAVNMAYLQGRRLRGTAGAMAAIFGTILPSFVIILLIAWIALPYFAKPKVTAFLRGCAIAVVGQLAFAGLVFARKLLRSWRNAIVCIAGLIVVAVFKMHPVWAMIAAGGMGYLLCNQSAAEQNEKDQS